MQLSNAKGHEPARQVAAHVIRPVSPSDEDSVQQFIRELSPASRHSRFMMAIRELPADILDRFVHPASGREAALVATSPDGDIVGLAQYVADEKGDGCEVALVVSDTRQRQGLGAKLLTALASVASENAIRHLHADVLADNYAMRALAQKVGCEVRVNPETTSLVEISRTIQYRPGASAVAIYQ
jgi:RimJ/RimL family protein N-acetyltransferase